MNQSNILANSSVTRRRFLQMAGVITGSAVALPLMQGCVALEPVARNTNGMAAPASGSIKVTSDVVQEGKLFINEKDDATFHTYLSPDGAYYVTTHIIETANSLVLVDGQMYTPYASEVRAYADSLGKPIERIFISHMHPDHWVGLGLDIFEGIPLYTSANVQAGIDAFGDFYISSIQERVGPDFASDKKIVPDNTVQIGSEVIDGLIYEFDIIENGEAPEHLLIKIPSAGTLIAQDLVFNKAHLFLGHNLMDGWISALNQLKTLTDYETVLAGHGEPTGMAIYDEDIAYLELVQGVLGAGGSLDDLGAALLEAYPDFAGEMDIIPQSLYLLAAEMSA